MLRYLILITIDRDKNTHYSADGLLRTLREQLGDEFSASKEAFDAEIVKMIDEAILDARDGSLTPGHNAKNILTSSKLLTFLYRGIPECLKGPRVS